MDKDILAEGSMTGDEKGQTHDLSRWEKPKPTADEAAEGTQTHVGSLALTYLEHETPVYREPSDTFIPAPPVSSVPPDTVLLVLAVRRRRFGSTMALVIWDGGTGWVRTSQIGVLC